MKLAIIGSRTCPPVDIEAYLKYIPDTIVSGGAIGADTYAKEFAIKHNLKLIEFLPDYEKYGRKAPLVRNKLIVEECDCLIAFWDGKSRGTGHMISFAKRRGLDVSIFDFTTRNTFHEVHQSASKTSPDNAISTTDNKKTTFRR